MKTIFLEFRHENGALAANGSDSIFYLDGRWSTSTINFKIYERVAELRTSNPRRSAYSKQLFVGYTVAGKWPRSSKVMLDKHMADRNPPEWAKGRH